MNASTIPVAPAGVSGNVFSVTLLPRILTVLVLVASGLGLLSLLINDYDDSILLVGARLVAEGKLPYVDFYTHYGPLGPTILSVLLRVLGHPGLALRVGQIILLAAIAVLLHWLFRSLQPRSPLREYGVVPLVFAFSQVATQAAFFGFAFAAGGLILFTLARSASRVLPAYLLAAAAGLALAAAALIRPGFGIYVAGALLALEVSAGRPQFGSLRNPFLAFGLLFGTAVSAAFVVKLLLYPSIPPALAFSSAIIVPGLLMSSGARFLHARYLWDVGAFPEGVATCSAFVAMTLAWVFAVARQRQRQVAAACIVAGAILPFGLRFSEEPARLAGFLALALLVLPGLAAFTGRPELQQNALLRASATFGIGAAAFGHYFWARSDVQHLLPFLALALVGGALLMTSLPGLARAVLAGVFLLAWVPALNRHLVPAATLLKRDVVTHLRPWLCTGFPIDVAEAIAFADRLADPGSRFVAVGSTQAWSSGNPVVLFLVSTRLPYTRWFPYDPGLQTSPEVQQDMMRELEASGSRTAVVWNAEQFLWAGEDPRGRPRSAFDDFFDRLYPVTAARIGGYEIRLRE